MIKVYANLILMGLKTLDEVPKKIQLEVEQYLKAISKEDDS